MRLGILGAGQLARMMAMAALPLGITIRCFDETGQGGAKSVADCVNAQFDDDHALQHFARSVDLITIESENIPLSVIDEVTRWTPVLPTRSALFATQDRLREKQLFRRLGINTADFCEVNSVADLKSASAQLGLPLLLKTRSGGYDGKGQVLLQPGDDLNTIWAQMDNQPCIAEAWVNFDREVSLIAVRTRSGITHCYDLVENHHHAGILRESRNLIGDPQQRIAQILTTQLLDELDYCGVLTLEFFQVGDHLLANEYAPRVHNSGHWTIEGSETSQFENHLRAIFNLPLGSTRSIAQCKMINCIGELPNIVDVLSQEGAHYHDYGKSPRANRKVGHITVRTPLSYRAQNEVVEQSHSLTHHTE